ncbi:hypothetical protein ACOME3_001400 [Neoechinorhynchus agilis]
MSALADLFGPDEECTDGDLWFKADCESLADCLPPEPQVGNMEYKLKLDTISADRFDELVTQMKWRLHEGKGEAGYMIGVDDRGSVVGLSKLTLDRSIQNLRKMAANLNASVKVHVILSTKFNDNMYWAKTSVLIKKPIIGLDDCKVAFVGAAGSGKSTLISVLSRDRPDDGHGSARFHMFQHRHEINSGRTSSIITETIGSDKSNRLLLDPFLNEAARTLTLIDLAGHEKYIRTALYGLTSYNPDIIVLVISAISQRKFPLDPHFLTFLGKPLIIIVNKCDLLPNENGVLEQIINSFNQAVVLKRILDEDDIDLFASKVNKNIYDNEMFMSPAWISRYERNSDQLNEVPIVPVFTLSCVRESGLSLLKMFLGKIARKRRITKKNKRRSRAWFRVLTLLKMTESDIVVSGLMIRGQLIVDNEPYFLGPFKSNQFKQVTVKSIRSHNVPCSALQSGQFGSVALGGYSHDSNKYKLKGLTLFATDRPPLCMEFVALVIFRPRFRRNISKALTIRLSGLEVMVHTNNICKSAKIIGFYEVCCMF